MNRPIRNARLRPIIEPIFPPVTMSIAITSVYRTIALWMPVIEVSRSSATVAIETFMTELSSAIRNCPAHRVSSTTPAPVVAALLLGSEDIGRTLARLRAVAWHLQLGGRGGGGS